MPSLYIFKFTVLRSPIRDSKCDCGYIGSVVFVLAIPSGHKPRHFLTDWAAKRLERIKPFLQNHSAQPPIPIISRFSATSYLCRMPTQTLGKRRLSSGSPPPQSSSSASSSRGPRTNSAALKPSQEELGLSALVVCNADQEVSSSSSSSDHAQILFLLTCCLSQAKLNYVSESMQDILGYTSSDLIGKSVYLIFHPDEVPFLRQIH